MSRAPIHFTRVMGRRLIHSTLFRAFAHHQCLRTTVYTTRRRCFASLAHHRCLRRLNEPRVCTSVKNPSSRANLRTSCERMTLRAGGRASRVAVFQRAHLLRATHAHRTRRGSANTSRTSHRFILSSIEKRFFFFFSFSFFRVTYAWWFARLQRYTVRILDMGVMRDETDGGRLK